MIIMKNNSRSVQISNISGGGITIFNGQIIGRTPVEMTKIDETKQSTGNAKRLVIDSKIAAVSITVGATSNVTAHLFGECNFDGSAPTLSVTDKVQEVIIDVKWFGNCFTGQLNLEITVPNSLYNSISISTQVGSVSVGNSVKAKRLQAKTQSGHVSIETETCETLTISTMSGGIDVELTANTDVSLNLQAMSGGIDVNLSNVATLNLKPSTISGSIRNRLRNSTVGHTADVSASTISGSIRIG